MTTTGWISIDGDPKNKKSINLTAEMKSDSVYISNHTINHLYAVQITNKKSGITIESSLHVNVNGTEIGSTGKDYAVRDGKAYATIPKLLQGLGFEIISQNNKTTVTTAVKGGTKIEFDIDDKEIKITDERGNTKKKKVIVENINGRDMVEIKDIGKLPETSVDWSVKSGKIDIATDEFEKWETTAGKVLHKAFEFAWDFLFDDVKTLFDPEASSVDRIVALSSMLPWGKGIKVINKTVDFLKPYVDAEDIKKIGNLTGSLKGLTDDEQLVVHDLLGRGRTVEVIPKDPESKVKSPDFKVDGILTELKTLQNANTNTGMKRIQEGFAQGAQVVILDARKSGLTSEQAKEIINRSQGKYPDKRLPGKVEIWLSNETVTN